MSVMATQFTSPPLASPPLFQQYSGVQYNPNQNPSQPNTATTSPSSSSSPPSPRSTYVAPHLRAQAHMRQQPKTDLYIPAVLRPTEKPTRNSPPKDARSSYESDRLPMPTERLSSPKNLEASISRVTTEDWNDEALGKVTGPPTRDHWKPDPSSPKCDSPTCATSFTILQRRHHCRRCGNIFCSNHSAGQVPLDQHARFHPDGTVQRACDKCYRDYDAWLQMRSSRSNSQASDDSSSTHSPTASRLAVPVRTGQGGVLRVGSLAASVPRDWSWSTF